MWDTAETPKGDLSVDASGEPKGSHPLAIKKDLHFYKCRYVGGGWGVRKEWSDGIAQRSGASLVVNNHFCDNSGWHTNRRKRKAAHLVWTAFFCDQNGVASRWRRMRDSNPRGLAPKRFSRPPRCDRFDNPPNETIVKWRGATWWKTK